MRVSLQTYGGLTGGVGRPAQIVDSGELDDEDRQELHRLVAAARAQSRAAGPPDTEQLRDAQTYEITIDDGADSVVLEATDGSVPADFAQLRDWVRDHQGG
jgi:hypothetical protein